jgi:hypothetical protein
MISVLLFPKELVGVGVRLSGWINPWLACLHAEGCWQIMILDMWCLSCCKWLPEHSFVIAIQNLTPVTWILFRMYCYWAYDY